MLLTVLQSLPWPALLKSLSAAAAAAAARRCALVPGATLSLRSGLRENQHRLQNLQGSANSYIQWLEEHSANVQRHWQMENTAGLHNDRRAP